VPQNASMWRTVGLTAGVAALLLCAAAFLGFLAGRTPVARLPDSVTNQVTTDTAQPADATSFIAAVAGDWQGPQERLLIKNDKGVMEILRQTRAKGGEIRLDQFVAAPVRLEPGQRRLELETADGLWLLTLIPGERRAQLSITYPDKQNVLYQ
jgi:hypothetical protein